MYAICLVLIQSMGPNEFVLEGFLTHCSFDYTTRDMFTRSLAVFLFIGGFFLPLLISTLFNWLIWLQLKSPKQYTNIQFANTKNSAKNLRKKRGSINKLRQKKLEKIVLRTTAKKSDTNHIKSAVFIFFMLCLVWGAYASMTLLAQFGQNINIYISPLTINLTYLLTRLSSIINPIVFTLCNKKCRRFIVSVCASLMESGSLRGQDQHQTHRKSVIIKYFHGQALIKTRIYDHSLKKEISSIY